MVVGHFNDVTACDERSEERRSEASVLVVEIAKRGADEAREERSEDTVLFLLKSARASREVKAAENEEWSDEQMFQEYRGASTMSGATI